MIEVEDKLSKYIETFLDPNEKEIYCYTEKDNETNNNYQSFVNNKEWIEIINLYKTQVNNNCLNNFILKVSPFASFFINQIYQKHCNNETTLLITSQYEHTNVRECQKNIKHVLRLNYNDLINFNSENVIKIIKETKCTNVLVYVVGTCPYNGKITPQKFYIDIKKCLDKYYIPYVLVCDAVHELYLNDRDYSIFDYVIYNCKPLIQQFNMGMIWMKNNKICGGINYSRMYNYFEKLNIFKSKLNKLDNFYILIKDFFSDILNNYVEILSNDVKWIITFKTKNLIFMKEDQLLLKDYGINLEDLIRPENYISLRIQSFINKDPKYLINGLNYLKLALKRAIKRKNLSF